MPAQAISITPAQLMAQWADVPHKFMVAVHNFEVDAGQAAVGIFKKSFILQKFNSAGGYRPWAPLQGKYGRRICRGGFKPRILMENSILVNSIKVKNGTPQHQITVHTDPDAFASSPRHPGFCYAAVHNNLNSLINKPKYGPKKERQFMGNSTLIIQLLHRRMRRIFINMLS